MAATTALAHAADVADVHDIYTRANLAMTCSSLLVLRINPQVTLSMFPLWFFNHRQMVSVTEILTRWCWPYVTRS